MHKYIDILTGYSNSSHGFSVEVLACVTNKTYYDMESCTWNRVYSLYGKLPPSLRERIFLTFWYVFKNEISVSFKLHRNLFPQDQSLLSLYLLTLACQTYYMNWLTHDFWTRTGGWEFYRSHGVGTSSPSHWQQVEEQAPKPVGWMMCYLLMTLVPIQKLCVNIYIYIYMHSLYEFCYRTYIYIYIYI